MRSAAMWKVRSRVAPLCVRLTRLGSATPSTSTRSSVLGGVQSGAAWLALLASVPAE